MIGRSLPVLGHRSVDTHDFIVTIISALDAATEKRPGARLVAFIALGCTTMLLLLGLATLLMHQLG